MPDLSPLTEEQEAKAKLVESVASVLCEDMPTGFGDLSDMQRKFASAYVLLAGNATKAAQIAGYNNPSIMGQRATLNPKVSELIRVLSLATCSAALPIAMQALIDIASDPSVKPETRRNAALDLGKMAGAMGQAGPQVAVQVNASGGTSKDGESMAPTIVLQNVWSNRDARLSSIAPPMPDTSPRVINHTDDPPDEGGGGG